jgi:peptidoglycan/LPS O-acetylase OafA/YrhL
VDKRFSDPPSVNGIGSMLAAWGVYIFFIISGFIITKLALAEYNHKKVFSVKNFYIRRAFRIIPPFYAYLICIFILAHFSLINQRPRETVTAAAFFCNLPIGNCGWFVAHTWTLAFEEQFYLVFAIFFVVIAQYARKCFKIAFLALFILCFFSTLFLGFLPAIVFRFAHMFAFLSVGAVMAAYEQRIERVSKGRAGRYVSGIAVLTLILIALSSWYFVNVAGIDNVVLLYLEYYHINYVMSFNIILLCLASLVGISIYRNNFISKILTTPVVVFLGIISYSLYLWQELFAANPGDFFGSNKILEQPLLILVMAISSFYLIERPSIRMGRRVIRLMSARISTRRTAKMAPPPASPELTVKGELAPE